MNKYLLYIVNIDNPNGKVKCNDYAIYCIKTWEHWCKRHDVDLLVIDENVGNFKFPIWNKELIHKFGQGYEKIGMVDADTMVRWDVPNILDEVKSGIYGVNDLCDLNWLSDSIETRKHFFPNTEMDIFQYLNAGVLWFDSGVLDIFKKLLDFYEANQTEIDSIQTGGKEQTFLNFMLQENKVPITLLHPTWNLLSIHKKNMFSHNWQLKLNETPYFIKYAYVWHFTGFPIEQRVEIMKKVWEYIKDFYE
jgi:lipopolysaccharide biosynthesis glycosyltransferase